MPKTRKGKELSTSALLGEAREYLGLEQGNRRGGKMRLTRKEKRSRERAEKKSRKNLRTEAKHKRNAEVTPISPQEKDNEAAAETNPKPSGATLSTQPPRKKMKISDENANAAPSAEVDPEDMEIARLEKLLGIKSDATSRKKAAAKLNKEYAQFEGLGDNFGDFLLGLDNIMERNKSAQREVNGTEENSEDMSIEPNDYLVDDDEFPESDISYESELDEASDEPDESMEDEELLSGNENNGSDDFDSTSEKMSDSEEEIDSDDSGGGNEEIGSTVYYAPSKGEDIYGNARNEDSKSLPAAKYVPPALRNNSDTAALIDERSEKYMLLRRMLNGLLNRVSDDNKDSIVRSVKDLFDTHSHQECCHCLNKCIMSACSNSTQVVATLIPLFAAVVSALHFTIGISIGSSLLELLVLSFHKVWS